VERDYEARLRLTEWRGRHAVNGRAIDVESFVECDWHKSNLKALKIS
jgi:hypothetical protein